MTSACDGNVKVWSRATGEVKQTIDAQPTTYSPMYIMPGGSYIVKSIYMEGGQPERAGVPMAVAPSGDLLLCGNKKLNLYDLNSSTLVSEFAGHTGPVLALAVTPDAGTWISAGMDKTIRLWRSGAGQAQPALEGHTGFIKALAVSENGRFLASGDSEGTVMLWDLRQQERIARFPAHQNIIVALAFMNDDTRIISLSGDCEMRVWEASSRSRLPEFATNLAGAIPQPLVVRPVSNIIIGPWAKSRQEPERNGMIGPMILAVTIVPRIGCILASITAPGGRQAPKTGIWDIGSGAQIGTFDQGAQPAEDLSVTQDGKYALIGHANIFSVWDFASRKRLAEFVCDSSVSRIAAGSPDGHFIVGEVSGRVHFLWLQSNPEDPDREGQ
jgi:WD40 repeat protein